MKYPFALRRESSGFHAPEMMACEVEYAEILYWMCLAKEYGTILEIGTYKGHTTWWWNEVAKEVGGYVVTVDPAPQEHIEYDFVLFVTAKSNEFLQDPSQMFDFIFIDGDHTREGCIEDFKLALQRLEKGGTIAIHDTLMMPGVREALLDAKIIKPKGWREYTMGKGLAIWCEDE